MKKKIIYIMNVDWNWIKQRPHFVAERLGEVCNLKIIYRYKYNRNNLQNRDNKKLDLVPIYVIPGLNKIKKLSWINEKLLNYKVSKLIMEYNPDVIYVTYPTQISMIPTSFKGRIIYDCMDNHAAFVKDIEVRRKLEVDEKKLIEKSYRVLVSSEYLNGVIKNKYKIFDDSFILVRNAYDGNIIENVKENTLSERFRMAYIGTLSSWFDWENIMKVITDNCDVELHLYGPVDKTIIPEHNRVIYHGTIEHNKLYDTIADMNCLIMPFVVNEIIRAVDPVKIYEYINFGKDIIMCSYDEVKRFDKFVYFYDSAEDFSRAIACIKKSGKVKYSNIDRIRFLKENNWNSRIEQIIDVINL